MMRLATVVLSGFVIAADPVVAQLPDACTREAADLVAQVRAATTRYSDVADAIADGYRRVGMDFPGMGEHWISLREATRDHFDPARPQILLYIDVDGERRIAGAAFTALQDPGESIPGPRFLRDSWHEHSGTLDDELFAVDHAGSSDGDHMRVLVLHVWTRWPSTGSAFDVENWNLPFQRAGIAPPEPVDIVVARAVSLAHSANYYVPALHRMGVPDTDADRARLRALLEARADDVHRILESHGTRRTWSASERAALTLVWRKLMRDVGSAWPATASLLPALERTPHATTCSAR